MKVFIKIRGYIMKLYFEYYVLTIALAIVLFVSFKIVLASGNPDSYYMRLNPGLVTTYCVHADINWRSDDVIYCSEDISKILLFNLAMNAQIQQTPPPTPEIIQKKDPKGIV